MPSGISYAAHLRTPRDVPVEELTPREKEVLILTAEDNSVKEIARTLNVAQKTVESVRWRLMCKLGVNTAIGLVRYTIRKGLVKL